MAHSGCNTHRPIPSDQGKKIIAPEGGGGGMEAHGAPALPPWGPLAPPLVGCAGEVAHQEPFFPRRPESGGGPQPLEPHVLEMGHQVR